MPRNGYAHMVHDHYVDRVRAIRAARQERLASIRTRRQAQAYQQEVRRAIRRAYGPTPPRTPLNAQITGTLERRHYRLEKILFESRPGCLVTAHLYLPAGLDGPAPAVLGTCGHSGIGKLEPLYQEFCQRLARSGFAVLIYDPFNQGERDQYWRLPDRSPVASCTHAHNMMGKQLELIGEWFGAWRAWDGIRALDYLLDRPEVDATRVGLTGNSGGGTMTTWLWGFEERFTMAAPSCFVTTFLANLENELPADCEQYPPGVIGAGLEMADFIIARAPEPALLLGQTYDFFDRRGLREAYAEVRRFYDLLGAPEADARLFIGPNPHGFSRHNQEAMVDFFTEHARLPRVVKVRAPEHLDEARGNVTPKGNTVDAGATPIYDQIAARADELQGKRKKPGKSKLVEDLTALLHLPKRQDAPHYRVLRPDRAEGQTCARYAVETEGNIRAILRKRLEEPARAGVLEVEKEVHLYLPHTSSEEDLTGDRLAIVLRKKHPLYALDVRGLGESMPDEGGGNFFAAYGMDYMFDGHSLLLGESYIGRRVHDTLATIDLLVATGARQIRLYGRGQGALVALFASLLHDAVKSVTLKNAPLAYREWTRAPLVFWPSTCFLRDALSRFDLPDLVRALGRRVRLIQPWGPDMKPLTGAKLKKALAEAKLPASLIQRA